MSSLSNFMLWLLFWCNQTCIFRIYANQEVYPVYLLSPDNSELSENIFYPDDKTYRYSAGFELWNTCNESHGDLVMSQIASEIKPVPVWKSIDEHLKDIDLYVTAVENVVPSLRSWYDVEVNSGASGVLTVSDEIGYFIRIDKPMYSWDPEQARMVPIPKFVYRIIRARCSFTHEILNAENHNKIHNAVIIIHNDPTAVSDDDRLDCESCFGWDEVENTDPEVGLTYVCHLSKNISEILGIEDYDPESPPLNLNSMEFTSSENWYWTSLTCSRHAGDRRDLIYEKYLKLKGSD